MNELAHFILLPLKKNESYHGADWIIRDKELAEDEICMATRDVLPNLMKDEV